MASTETILQHYSNKTGIIIMFNTSKHAVHVSNTENSIPFSQENHQQVGEIIAVCSENLTVSLNTLYARNSGYLKQSCCIYEPLLFLTMEKDTQELIWECEVQYRNL
jgi:hypothetical protein